MPKDLQVKKLEDIATLTGMLMLSWMDTKQINMCTYHRWER